MNDNKVLEAVHFTNLILMSVLGTILLLKEIAHCDTVRLLLCSIVLLQLMDGNSIMDGFNKTVDSTGSAVQAKSETNQASYKHFPRGTQIEQKTHPESLDVTRMRYGRNHSGNAASSKILLNCCISCIASWSCRQSSPYFTITEATPLQRGLGLIQTRTTVWRQTQQQEANQLGR